MKNVVWSSLTIIQITSSRIWQSHLQLFHWVIRPKIWVSPTEKQNQKWERYATLRAVRVEWIRLITVCRRWDNLTLKKPSQFTTQTPSTSAVVKYWRRLDCSTQQSAAAWYQRGRGSVVVDRSVGRWVGRSVLQYNSMPNTPSRQQHDEMRCTNLCTSAELKLKTWRFPPFNINHIEAFDPLAIDDDMTT